MLALMILAASCMYGQTNLGPIMTTTQDQIGTSSAPSNPASGNCRSYFNSLTGVITYINSVGANCGPSASGFPVIAPQQVLSGGAITPVGTGEIASTGDWFVGAPGVIVPPVPTVTVSNTGGSLTQNVNYVRITYVGLSAIVPSAEVRVQLNATNCASNTTCQMTVTMPTSCTAGNLPAGVTGCTVWDSSNLSNTEKQQTASNACVNITTATCVINVLATGSTIPNPPATTGVAPSPITAISQPDFIVPTNFLQIGDGSYIPSAGIDYSALNVITNNANSGVNPPAIGSIPGTFTWTHRFFFNDTNAAPIQANNFVSIHHKMCQTTGCVSTANGAGVDDRAFGVEMVNAGVANPFVEQYLTQYNENLIQNNSFTCNPISGGTPWGESCAAAGRFVSSDNRTANNGSSYQVGVAGVTNSGTATAVATGTIGGYIGVQGGAYQSTVNTNGGGALWVGGWFGVNAAGGNTNGSGAGIALPGPTTKFASGNIAEYINNGWSTNGSGDYAIRSDSASKSSFVGPMWLTSLFSNAPSIPVQGGLTGASAFSTSTVSTPTLANCVAQGTTGSTTITYKGVAKDANGNYTAASAACTVSNANATLSAGNSVLIQINAFSTAPGAASFDIYRTTTNGTSPTTTGKIGNVPCATGTIPPSCGTLTFTDTGLAPTVASATPPTSNSTGSEVLTGTILSANTQSTTGANFTTSSAALVALYTWHLAAGTNRSFRCSLTYSQQTAAVGMTLGVQAGANTAAAPINVMASAEIYTNTTGVLTTGTLATLATTTATTVLAGGAPSAINQNNVAFMDGTVEMNATDPGDFSIMVATANAADQITILRGSFCYLTP